MSIKVRLVYFKGFIRYNKWRALRVYGFKCSRTDREILLLRKVQEYAGKFKSGA